MTYLIWTIFFFLGPIFEFFADFVSRNYFPLASFHLDFAFFQALAKTQNKRNILLEVWIFVEEGRVSNRINDSRIEIGVNESSKSHFIKRMHKLKLLYSYLTNSSSDSCCAVGAYRPIVYLRLALLTVHRMALWYYLLTDDRELKKCRYSWIHGHVGSLWTYWVRVGQIAGQNCPEPIGQTASPYQDIAQVWTGWSVDIPVYVSLKKLSFLTSSKLFLVLWIARIEFVSARMFVNHVLSFVGDARISCWWYLCDFVTPKM